MGAVPNDLQKTHVRSAKASVVKGREHLYPFEKEKGRHTGSGGMMDVGLPPRETLKEKEIGDALDEKGGTGIE